MEKHINIYEYEIIANQELFLEKGSNKKWKVVLKNENESFEIGKLLNICNNIILIYLNSYYLVDINTKKVIYKSENEFELETSINNNYAVIREKNSNKLKIINLETGVIINSFISMDVIATERYFLFFDNDVIYKNSNNNLQIFDTLKGKLIFYSKNIFYDFDIKGDYLYYRNSFNIASIINLTSGMNFSFKKEAECFYELFNDGLLIDDLVTKGTIYKFNKEFYSTSKEYRTNNYLDYRNKEYNSIPFIEPITDLPYTTKEYNSDEIIINGDYLLLKKVLKKKRKSVVKETTIIDLKNDDTILYVGNDDYIKIYDNRYLYIANLSDFKIIDLKDASFKFDKNMLDSNGSLSNIENGYAIFTDERYTKCIDLKSKDKEVIYIGNLIFKESYSDKIYFLTNPIQVALKEYCIYSRKYDKSYSFEGAYPKFDKSGNIKTTEEIKDYYEYTDLFDDLFDKGLIKENIIKLFDIDIMQYCCEIELNGSNSLSSLNKTIKSFSKKEFERKKYEALCDIVNILSSYKKDEKVLTKK